MTIMIKIFTDGAASRNGLPDAKAGWGWVAYDENNNILSEDCGPVKTGLPTNNRGEILAILEAFKYAAQLLENFNPSAAEVVVYSDSAYCVNGYNDWMHNWQKLGWWRNKKQTSEVKNRDLWIELYEYYDKGLPVTVEKVKGHAGIMGNEYADKLAAQGKEMANEDK